MKNVMYGEIRLNVPNLDSQSGYGTVNIPSKLYHEYMLKLQELIELSNTIKQIAIDQDIPLPRDY